MPHAFKNRCFFLDLSHADPFYLVKRIAVMHRERNAIEDTIVIFIITASPRRFLLFLSNVLESTPVIEVENPPCFPG